jgi:hypothetical protein
MLKLFSGHAVVLLSPVTAAAMADSCSVAPLELVAFQLRSTEPPGLRPFVAAITFTVVGAAADALPVVVLLDPVPFISLYQAAAATPPSSRIAIVTVAAILFFVDHRRRRTPAIRPSPSLSFIGSSLVPCLVSGCWYSYRRPEQG